MAGMIALEVRSFKTMSVGWVFPVRSHPKAAAAREYAAVPKDVESGGRWRAIAPPLDNAQRNRYAFLVGAIALQAQPIQLKTVDSALNQDG